MRKGFTLVELSIVLVIIGLLVGGILVAQSMIGTTRITGLVKQLSEYDIAVSNFKTMYNQLPGDSTLFPTGGGIAPNNNGAISGYDIGRFWYHLSLGVGLKNYRKNDYVYFDYIAATITEDICPRFKIDQDLSSPPCLGITYVWAPGTVTLANLYSYGAAGYYPLKAADALAIDKKIDNGVANSGAVGGYGVSSSYCSNGAAYLTADPSYTCYLHIMLGTASGVVKSTSDSFN